MADSLIALARRIAREAGRLVPTPNPEGPTTRALCLFVLRDPGATETSGANETGVLDPFANRDPSAISQQKALAAAGIDPGVCVWWNASPYHLGYKGPLREPEVANGARYLLEFVSYCPQLRVVVPMGGPAQQVAYRAWSGRERDLPPLIPAPHPLIYGTGWQERRDELDAALRKVACLLRG